MIVDLADTPGAWLAALALVGLKGAEGGFSGSGFRFCFRSFLPNSLVDLCRSCALHLICHMGVDVQSCAAGHMTNDGGEGFYIHAVLQRGGSEGMTQVVEADVFTFCPFQNRRQSLSHCRWVHGGVLLHRGGEHPPRGTGCLVGVQDSQNRGREDNTAIGGFCLWLGHHQFPSHSMHLTLYPQSTGAEIKVIPLKGADFAPAQARGQFQQEQLISCLSYAG